MAPGAEVIVTLAPPNCIGLKVLELVKAKVVKPENVTTVFAFSLERSMVLFVGAAIFWRVIAVQEATAGAIWEKAVQVHVGVEIVKPPPPELVLELVDEGALGVALEVVVGNVGVELLVDVGVNEGAELLDGLGAAVNRQEQAVESLDT